MVFAKTQGWNTGRIPVDQENTIGMAEGWRRKMTSQLQQLAVPVPATGALMLWGPWSFCIGVALTLMTPISPSLPVLAACLSILVLAMIWLKFKQDHRLRLFFSIGLMAFAIAGGTVAQWRTQAVAAPVMPARDIVWTVEGKIRNLDRDTGKRVRILLDVTQIEHLAMEDTPKRVRIGTLSTTAQPGDMIRVRAKLTRPTNAAFPGAYDMARGYWFEQVGGVGFAYGRVDVLQSRNPDNITAGINRWRRNVTTRLHEQLPGETGALAAALLTGDRSGISDDTLTAYREAGLGHLLAISGLHMSLVGGLVFLLCASLFAILPGLGTRMDARKPAALVGLAAAFTYLLLSGGSAPTQRAFVMLAIIFLAVLLSRRALSIRTISLAALIVAGLRPEFVVQPGFQMSFAASLALVAFYQRFQSKLFPPIGTLDLGMMGWVLRSGRLLTGIALTSLVAGIATAPFASWHFHRVALFSLLANILAMPVFLILVMPFLLLGLILMPTGLGEIFLQIGGMGLDLVTWIAGHVAHMPGAVWGVRATSPWGLLLEAMALIVFCLSLGRMRMLAGIFLASGMLVRALTPAPIGWIGAEGAAFESRDGHHPYLVILGKPDGFAITQFAQSLGKQTLQTVAAKDAPGTHCDALGCGLILHGQRIMYREGAADLESDCALSDLILLHARIPSRKAPACANTDVMNLRDTAGSLVYWQDGHFVLRNQHALRRWNSQAKQRAKAISDSDASSPQGNPAP